MKNTTHRVVILKNVNSDLISQAILILKDSARENDTNLMVEAEKIVEKYMHSGCAVPTKNKSKLIAGIASVGIALITLALFITSRLI